MTHRQFALIGGLSYVVIFFAAIFANFFVLEALLDDPAGAVEENGFLIRLGIMAFLITAVFDIFVAWALYELYPNHPLTRPSTYFRIAHAIIMGVAVFALPLVFFANGATEILLLVYTFNSVWLIGLFFFGVHLVLLSRIVKHIKIIPYIMAVAGVMYMIDTSAHFLIENYNDYADTFLMLVAIPSIFGEMAFALCLLFKEGKETSQEVEIY